MEAVSKLVLLNTPCIKVSLLITKAQTSMNFQLIAVCGWDEFTMNERRLVILLIIVYYFTSPE